ncbi:ANTAR domain-containing protein [Lipingzhangella sp. LS1_29]|uniref:ANTAR domain-containing protein n=1 Tax=Lipingzhangella rawalii TaxID=2055835 RepID=A0ABU2HB99_9ACTN|nr:ANTAR domain-containing protein [Lipingzhangella rawalii]MDS1272556.1 ANTAR domain-containing protein [Lipingzhangella rawalii]
MTETSTLTEESASCHVVRRTPDGWRVGEDDLPDLLNAMVLADLLGAGQDSPGSRPAPSRAEDNASETERLRVTVAQLEHALCSRVVVEQAIGILAERKRIDPRTAFNELRWAARARGRKVADLARSVVSSTNDPLIALPPELARPGSVTEAPRT